MRFKTLLLGSVATFAFAGGNAAAADLSVAEPVDYVRVCDAFGSGFWYIPQTDVCVAIGSRVRLAAEFDSNIGKNGDSDWAWETKADANLTMKKMTDWGPLTTYVSFDSGHDSSSGGSSAWELDEAYFSVGPATVGYTGSVSNAGVGFTDTGFDLMDASGNVINLSFDVGGIGFFIGIENPQDRWGSSSNAEIPDLSLAVELDAGGVALFGSAVIAADCDGDSAFAVAGTAETSVGMLDLQAGAVYAAMDSCGPDGGNGFAVQDGWAGGASIQANWTDTFQTAATLFWTEPDGDPNYWQGAASAFFQPVDGMETILDVSFDEDGMGGINLEVAVQLN